MPSKSNAIVPVLEILATKRFKEDGGRGGLKRPLLRNDLEQILPAQVYKQDSMELEPSSIYLY